MPVIQYQNPFAVGAEAAGSVLLAKKQQDKDERDYLLQKSDSDANAAYRKAQAANQAGQLQLDRRVNGLDENGNPIKVNAPDVGPGASLDDQYRAAILKANAYEAQGATALATPLYQQAERLQVAIHQARQDAIAYMKEADERLRIIAQAHHWSAQEKETARHNLATEAENVRKGNLTYDAAMARVGATIQAAEIHAGAEERGQDLEHSDRVHAAAITKRGQDLAHQDRQALLKAHQNGTYTSGGTGSALTPSIISSINAGMANASKQGQNPYAAATDAISGSPSLTPAQKKAALLYVRQLRLSSMPNAQP